MTDFKISLTNYTFEVPANWNIVIIANYRTGSTALGDLLSQLTGLPFIDEAFHFCPQARLGEFDSNTQSIIKIMPDQLPPEAHWDLLFNNSFIIGLYREDFTAQALSFGISSYLNVWHQEKNTDSIIKNPSIDIPLKHMVEPAKSLWRNQQRWKDCQSFFDIELCYEQLLPDLANSRYDAMPKLDFYNQKLEHLRTHVERWQHE
jgi:LPS sulfotransferase NodH